MPDSGASPLPDSIHGTAGSHVDVRARVAADVSMGPGVVIQGDVVVEGGVVIEPGVIISADGSSVAGRLVVGAGARLGAGSVVCGPVSVGRESFVHPGSVVTASTPAHSEVAGNPAQIVGYLSGPQDAEVQGISRIVPQGRGTMVTRVRGVTLTSFPEVDDIRGRLTVGEFDREIPFAPLRYFLVYAVPNDKVRGEHAHRECHQFLICVAGSCSIVVDDGAIREEITLDRASLGIHIPPMIWGVQYKYSPDAVLLVFASHHYDAQDYIRDYEQFRNLASTKP